MSHPVGAVRSMTGFGRGEAGGVVCEMRSVNGKGLDLRFRLPPGAEGREPELRKAAAGLFRGNVQVSFTARDDAEDAPLQVNEAALDVVLDAVGRIEDRTRTAPSSAAQLLALRGVLEAAAAGARAYDAEAVSAAFSEAVRQLIEARRAEGAELETLLRRHLAEIEVLVGDAEGEPTASPEATYARLRDQVRALRAEGGLDEGRLEQEAALLATRADVREETDRLRAHVNGARELLSAGSPCGRKLEFLAQEFVREANTLCSKSPSTELTRIGLALKAAIDQFREQVLNVE